MHDERGWTMERIGKALGVGKSTIARDLEDGFPQWENLLAPREAG
jgi:hypothetical protein